MQNNVFARLSKDIEKNLYIPETRFAKIIHDVEQRLKVASEVDRDADWHRVNSYIADVLKDAHVLYAKLARLQSDFGGAELQTLEEVSNQVLVLGESLSQFSKAFYEGDHQMVSGDVIYGQGQPAPPPPPPPPAAPPPPAPPEGAEEPPEFEEFEEFEAEQGGEEDFEAEQEQV